MHSILPHTDNPALREKALEIQIGEISSTRIQTLVHDMKALLAKEKFGVALAASQVGEPVRLFIVSGRALAQRIHSEDGDEAPEESDSPAPVDQVYINPEYVKISKKKTDKHEGCLSIRGKWGMVPRAEKASIRAYDENGIRFTRGASGFLAHIFQHEMDHLDGVLYSDKASELYDDKHEDDE